MEVTKRDIHTIVFPSSQVLDWRSKILSKLNDIKAGELEINFNNWALNHREIKELTRLIENRGFRISNITSSQTETIVSAHSLGYKTNLTLGPKNYSKVYNDNSNNKNPELLFHTGTLRSGEHLEAQGDVLLIGDINPGAQVSAGGDVAVIGKLLGIAHAGKFGNKKSKIMALQLRPLQLRIGEQIARCPEEKPERGLAEEARIESGIIVITPASSNWLRN